MASLYKRTNSPFWWIKFRDPKTGKTVRESTMHKVGIGTQTSLAEKLRAQRTLDESKASGMKESERWDCWVVDYLSLRYADAPSTLIRHQCAWRNLKMFLMEQQVEVPRQLTCQHCVNYMAWRQKPDNTIAKYRAGHNTAYLEIKVLRLLMNQAVKRNYALTNVCPDSGIKPIRPKIKPELTEAAEVLIRAGFDAEPEPRRTFLKNSYEIARWHGVRLTETYLNPLTDVQVLKQTPEGKIEQALITFIAKGSRVHTVYLHRELFPLFEALRTAHATETYPRLKSPSGKWHHYLKRCGAKALVPGLCFHSTRVTVATRFAKKGVSEKKAMAYIGHASTTVHRSYVRLRAEDLGECVDALY